MKVHTNGILGLINISIDPCGKHVYDKNRHSVFETDFGFVLKTLQGILNLAQKNNVGKFIYNGEMNVNDQPVFSWTLMLPSNQKFYGERIYICFSKKTKMPIKFAVWNSENILQESYEFNNLKIDQGYSEDTFDIENPEYNF